MSQKDIEIEKVSKDFTLQAEQVADLGKIKNNLESENKKLQSNIQEFQDSIKITLYS